MYVTGLTAYKELERWYKLMGIEPNFKKEELYLKKVGDIIDLTNYLYNHVLNLCSVFWLREKDKESHIRFALASEPMLCEECFRYTLPVASYFATFYKALKEGKSTPYLNALKYFYKPYFKQEALNLSLMFTRDVCIVPKNINTFKHVLAQINTFDVFVPDWLFQIKETL